MGKKIPLTKEWVIETLGHYHGHDHDPINEELEERYGFSLGREQGLWYLKDNRKARLKSEEFAWTTENGCLNWGSGYNFRRYVKKHGNGQISGEWFSQEELDAAIEFINS